MQVLRLAFRRFVANRRPPRLVRFVIRAGGYFLVSVLAREPDFDVVRLRGGCAEITAAQHYRAISQTQALQNIFGIGGKLLVLVVAVFRMREFHQLHLLELVIADDAAHVAPIRSSLAAKTWRKGAQRNRKLRFVDSLVAE